MPELPPAKGRLEEPVEGCGPPISSKCDVLLPGAEPLWLILNTAGVGGEQVSRGVASE